MPAPKKTNKNNALKKLDLNTPKGRLIVSVLAFAIIGGGIIVYKSFAAVATWTYTAAANTIAIGETPTASPCKTTKIELGDQKNPNPGFNLKCSAPGVADSYTPNAAFIMPKATPIDSTMVGKNFQICATARGKGELNLWLLSSFLPGQIGSSATQRSTINSSSFATYCTGTLAVSYSNANTMFLGRVAAGAAGSSIDVSNIIVREVANYGSTSSTSTAPASTSSTSTPAPTK